MSDVGRAGSLRRAVRFLVAQLRFDLSESDVLVAKRGLAFWQSLQSQAAIELFHFASGARSTVEDVLYGWLWRVAITDGAPAHVQAIHLQVFVGRRVECRGLARVSLHDELAHELRPRQRRSFVCFSVLVRLALIVEIVSEVSFAELRFLRHQRDEVLSVVRLRALKTIDAYS